MSTQARFACNRPSSSLLITNPSVHAALLLSLALLGLLAGCAGGSANQQELGRAGKAFTLDVYPDTYVAGGSADSITLRELPSRNANGVRVHDFVVEAHGATSLKALFFHLSYDATRFTPLQSKASAALGADDAVLNLTLGGVPGVVEFARMQTRPQDRAAQGFSGDGVLCSLSFAERPFARTQRTASTVAISDDARSTLVFNPVGPVLDWSLFNPGDYTQDGQVLASDLTPIGIHFNENVPAGGDPDGRDDNSVLDVADGNNDGKVAVGDLTAIGINFQHKVLSYNVYRSTDPFDVPTANDGPNGPGTSLVANVPMSAASGSPAAERIDFELGLSNDPTGAIYWVRPNDGVTDGTPSSTALGGSAANQAPIAALVADVQEGTAPLTVNFDASASADEGGIAGLSFLWDFDGDGNFDANTGNVPTVAHDFLAAGAFNARVKVTDSGALSDEATVEILVNTPGNVLPVADLQVSQSGSQAPVLVTLDASASTDSDGTIQEYRFDFDGDGLFDQVIPGNQSPIVHLNLGAGGTYNFKLQVVDDQNGVGEDTGSAGFGGGFDVNTVLDTGVNPPLDIALAPFNHTPGTDSRMLLAFMDESRSVQHSIASNLAGTQWDAPVLVSSKGSAHKNASLVLGVVSGLPTIAFIDEVSGSAIRYVRATDAAGKVWPAPNTAANGQRLRSPSLRIVDGFPGIAYITDSTTATGDASVFFVRSKNSVGSGAWDAPVLVDSSFPRDPVVETPRVQLLFQSGDQEPAVLCNSSALVREKGDNKKGSSWSFGPSSCTVVPALGASFALEAGDEGIGAFVLFDKTDQVTLLEASHPTNVFGFSSNLFPGDGTIDASPDLSPLVEFRRLGANGIVCYHDKVNHALKFARSTDSSAENYQTPQIIDFVDTDVFDISVLANEVYIVYFDEAQHLIKCATL